MPFDYASWVEKLDSRDIASIYRRFSGDRDLSDDFRIRFGVPLEEDQLNASHQVVLVASELDAATERIIGYLNERDVPINAVFFQVFEYGAEQLLSRAWLIDPRATQEHAASNAKGVGEREPWNGEFYASFGHGLHRDWEDARKYGYISAGGGSWYSQTLNLLSVGDRVWVRLTGAGSSNGYVGVGRVQEVAQSVEDFTVTTAQGGHAHCLEVLSSAAALRKQAEINDMKEWFVRIDWHDTVSEEQAFHELGLFGNQNSVCRPTASKWRHTVERLKEKFPNWNSGVG